ncbi:hypothetical protein [uncultured Reyranella sp.]|uniref:hypothetical protein n=1 Tax=uncultured Reyranella sp. TaxID=735512 RepID=UPI00259CE54C|nr:hypothetical protein [uncultured Reyranella sp.]
MTEITDLARLAWRDFATDGVPSSGINRPSKSDLRALGAAIDLQKAGTVDTLTAFKALANTPDCVVIKGKAAAYDGWGGLFVRVAGSLTAGDDAVVIRRTAGGDSYKRVFDGALQAEWFGFKADNLSGSGSANTTALQAAITAGAALKTRVELPSGTAYLAGTVNLAAPVQLAGKGWGTILKPTADAIGTMFNVTGSSIEIADLEIDAAAIVSPTFTALKVDTSGGFERVDNLYIHGAGVGIDVLQGNACRFSNLRIQACPVCIRTGGVAGAFPGDITWAEVVLIPTSGGTGWIVDGNTNAQYMHRIQIVGGAINLHVRGAGSGTSAPDGLIQSECNYTACSGPVIKIVKCWNFQLSASVVGGSTGDDGILIDPAATADVDGVLIDGCQIRANYKRGINWVGGANLQIVGGQVYGNSDGGGSGTYSNIYVGAAAKGLCHIVGVMAGLSASGELLANIQAPAKYGIELASGALTDATNFPGRLYVLGCILDGNTTGTISDASAPTGIRKIVDNIGGSRSGDLLFVDAAYDIGKSGATRPRDLFTSRDVVVGNNLVTRVTTVASLGSAATVAARAFVTDSNATLAAGHGNTVAGGGSNKVPVVADGTNWIIG